MNAIEPREFREPAARLPMHAESDVAALVYAPDVDPDPHLRAFFDRRLGEGWDALALLQERLPLDDDRRRRCRLRLAGDPDVADAGPADPHAHREVVAEMGGRLARLIDRGPDLLVLNRFGRSEARGGGLFSLMWRAVELDLPVVVAVPEGLFPVWLACAGGLAVRVRPEDGALERWWRSLGFGPSTPCDDERACAAWK